MLLVALELQEEHGMLIYPSKNLNRNGFDNDGGYVSIKCFCFCIPEKWNYNLSDHNVWNIDLDHASADGCGTSESIRANY